MFCASEKAAGEGIVAPHDGGKARMANDETWQKNMGGVDGIRNSFELEKVAVTGDDADNDAQGHAQVAQVTWS